MDYVNEGFQWLDCHQEERCIYAFERKSAEERILAIFNFSDQIQEDYVLVVPDSQKLELLIASDMEPYNGTKNDIEKVLEPEDDSYTFTLEAYSSVYYSIK